MGSSLQRDTVCLYTGYILHSEQKKDRSALGYLPSVLSVTTDNRFGALILSQDADLSYGGIFQL